MRAPLAAAAQPPGGDAAAAAAPSLQARPPPPPQVRPPTSPLPPQAPHREAGNTPSDMAFAAPAEEEFDGLAAAREASRLRREAAPPPLPRSRLLFGLLLFVAGTAATALGTAEGQPGLIAAGALALVPATYVLWLFIAVYALRRRDLFNELRDDELA